MKNSILVLFAFIAMTAAGAADTATNPMVAATLAYRDAKQRHDLPAQRALLSPGARMWFEKKEGAGSPLEATTGSGDPWEAWDRFFGSSSTIEATKVDGRTVRLTVSEVNDWYRLVERPPSRYYMSYEFDPERKLTGVLVHGIPDAPKSADRLGEFKAWAAANRPGLLEKLMPHEKLDPAIEKARLWRAALIDWRKAAGLKMPDGVQVDD